MDIAERMDQIPRIGLDIMGDQADALDGTMALILLYSFITFLFFFAYMVMERMELRNTEEALGRIRFTLRRRAASK